MLFFNIFCVIFFLYDFKFFFNFGYFKVIICNVNKVVFKFKFIVIVVIGIFFGIWIIDKSEFSLFIVDDLIGNFIIGINVCEVIIFGKCVVFFVVVIIILVLFFIFFRNIESCFGVLWVDNVFVIIFILYFLSSFIFFFNFG